MGKGLCALAGGVLLACQAASAQAQQGTLQISAAAQGLSGAPERLAGQPLLEPDFGVSWLQPGSPLGTFQIELRGTQRGDRLHLGRTYGSARDLRLGGFTWTLEAGDAYFSRGLGDYRFSNLTTPAVTFTGGAANARSTRATLHVTAGQATAWRNIFGSDPQTLEQSLLVGGGSYTFGDRLQVSGRASRIATGTMRDYPVSVANSRQAGAGVRFTPTPALQLVADGGLVRFRRKNASEAELDGSGLVGAHVLLARGWLQVNAARFSPGDFPAVSDPLRDREAVFAVGEYDVWRRVRVFGGWDWFRTAIGPLPPAGTRQDGIASAGVRGFGGVRIPLGSRSSLTLRAEEGDARSRSILQGLAFESDTGMWSAEWHGSFGPLSTYSRASRRENVSRTHQAGSYTQQDLSTQLFVRLSSFTQLFGVTTVTRHETGLAAGSAYWQAGGGAQVQVSSTLWVRGEATASHNVDLATRDFVPRASLNAGLSGQLARQTSISLDVSADRTPLFLATGTPWTTRSILRVVQTFATGSGRVSPAASPFAAAAARTRGTGTIVGTVFADWNGNGVQDPGEDPVGSIPVHIPHVTGASTARNGEFSFAGVPAGRQRVALDTAAIPVDYDFPVGTSVDLELDRGSTRRVSFGLIPLGTVAGRVFVDANGNGRLDAGEAPLDGAVLVLDGGQRSEQVRRGVYRFDAVRSGDHVLTLLAESLPEGAVITSPVDVRLSLHRDQRAAEVHFAVIIEKRPEDRRVFPPRLGAAPPATSPAGRVPPPARAQARPAAPAARPAARPGAAASAGPRAADGSAPGGRQGSFTLQLAALHDPVRARALARQLSTAGHAAYVLAPPPEDPDGPFRVRVGSYESRAAARAAAASLPQGTGDERPWIVRVE